MRKPVVKVRSTFFRISSGAVLLVLTGVGIALFVALGKQQGKLDEQERQSTSAIAASADAATADAAASASRSSRNVANTPETRALISALTAAVAAAEKVDAQRGNVLPERFPLQPGQSRGTGYAETLSNVLKRLEVEVYGPKGRE